MAIRFRKRVSIFPGVSLLVSKRGHHVLPKISFESAPKPAAGAATSPLAGPSERSATEVGGTQGGWRSRRRRRTLQAGVRPVKFRRVKLVLIVVVAVLLMIAVLHKAFNHFEVMPDAPSAPVQ